jgi:hypothetical protein
MSVMAITMNASLRGIDRNSNNPSNEGNDDNDTSNEGNDDKLTLC